ncbi:peptide-methionine-S-sulfoxide reductase [Saccharomycopsis crataegensis]|uniref:peptide-methionine (S)-S-oxide reductase n=1 Tax=Saccharomycopsis crataegensis TaxID=43959 RepID=A0AAV5QRP5_9ASCO|nr:peptide-methionine-S-sulfoxide reductase [Saccharomycopsis crataegensis]
MSVSKISPTLKVLEGSQLLTIAAGCFWGVEHIYRKNFQDKGIYDLKVGYANGDIANYKNPDYKTVCTGATNFAEALQVSFDPAKISYRELVAFFFRMHDATHLNHQGPDQGTQYRSAIFVNDEKQLSVAKEELEKAQKEWYPNHKIVTQIEYLDSFWDAEEYHQEYLTNNPTGYACPSHFIRTTPKV